MYLSYFVSSVHTPKEKNVLFTISNNKIKFKMMKNIVFLILTHDIILLIKGYNFSE